jgi:uncharacterized protein (DUF924 family)
MAPSTEDILGFWFGAARTDEDAVASRMRRWFGADQTVDAELSRRFGAAMTAAASGELDGWVETARGRLALILLLDQCPRSTHRGYPAAFEQDALALSWTLDGLADGMDRQLEPFERMFFYMPMQHAESLDSQKRSVEIFSELARADVPAFMITAMRNTADFARLHRDIIARFGRFPHRNAVLNRESTADEREYLEEGAPTFGQ